MIIDDKSWKKSEEILKLMEDGMTVGQFLDALVLAQCTILSVAPTHKAIREIAANEILPIKSNFTQCPICKSYNYEIGYFTSAHNCKCRDCGAMWWYNFPKL